jgi:thiol-disulfide isomerase/thioredoxin
VAINNYLATDNIACCGGRADPGTIQRVTRAAKRSTAVSVMVMAVWLVKPAGAGDLSTAERREERQRGHGAEVRVGDLTPNAVLETLDGDHIWLSGLKGKVVLLDFWASWCRPCIAGLPTLKRLAQTHGGRPFVLLSISGDSNGARLRDFVESHDLGWTQCWDGNASAQRQFGVHVFPTYFLLDPTGRIRYLAEGWNRRTEKELTREVEKALVDASSAPPGRAAF